MRGDWSPHRTCRPPGWLTPATGVQWTANAADHAVRSTQKPSGRRRHSASGALSALRQTNPGVGGIAVEVYREAAGQLFAAARCAEHNERERGDEDG